MSCLVCNKTIKASDLLVNVRARTYHKACFNCTVCKIDLQTIGMFQSLSGEIFCLSCSIHLVKRCFRCNRLISSPTAIKINDLYFHLDCLRCCQCNDIINEFYFKKCGLFYCPKDYYRVCISQCAGCAKPIESKEGLTEQFKLVKFENNHYHPGCFKCYFCKSQLKPSSISVLSRFRHILFYRIANSKIACAQCFPSVNAPEQATNTTKLIK